MMLGRFAGRPLLVRVAAPCHLRSMRTSAASGAAPMRSGAAVTGVRRAVAAASAWSRRGLFTPGALREAAGSAAAMATAPAPTKYSLGMMALHWGMAAAIGTTVGAVKLAQWTPKEDKKRKGELMKLHKSTALIVVALLVPRLAMRLFTKHPPAPEGHAIEKFAGHVSHTLLYAAMIFLPASGIAMGCTLPLCSMLDPSFPSASRVEPVSLSRFLLQRLTQLGFNATQQYNRLWRQGPALL